MTARLHRLLLAARLAPALAIVDAREALTRAAASVRLRVDDAIDDWAFRRLLVPEGPTYEEASPEVGLSFHQNDGDELGLRVTLVDEHEVERHGFVFLSRDMWDALEGCAPWADGLRSELDQLRERVGDPDKVAHHLYQIGATRGSLETRAETAREIYEAHLLDAPTYEEAVAKVLEEGANIDGKHVGVYQAQPSEDWSFKVWAYPMTEAPSLHDDATEAARAYVAIEREGRG